MLWGCCAILMGRETQCHSSQWKRAHSGQAETGPSSQHGTRVGGSHPCLFQVELEVH